MSRSRGPTDAEFMPFTALVDGGYRLGRQPSLRLRLRVRLHRSELTRRLADGADPHASPELALRARQLTAPREIRAAVKGLDRVLCEAAAPSRALTAQAPLQRAEILAARPFLLNLRQRLHESENPDPAGIAQTELLLTDGCGPLYAPSHPGTLASRAYCAACARSGMRESRPPADDTRAAANEPSTRHI
jgi:hypothetical protein